MKRMPSLVAGLVCLPALALAQESVKVNILDLYGQIPAPPSTLQEAHARAVCNPQGGCDVSRFYAPTEEKLVPLARQLDLLLAATNPAGGTSGGNMTAEQAQELERRLAAMSEEERIRFAMQMAEQQMRQPATMPVPEPAAVQAALEEELKLREQIGDQVVAAVETGSYENAWFLDHEAAAQRKLLAELERKHEEISAWSSAEWAKIATPTQRDRCADPEPWTGIRAYCNEIEPRERRVRAEEMDRRIAAEQEYLRELQGVWRAEINGHRARFTPFQQKLAAIRYGDDVKNGFNKHSLIGMQKLMLYVAFGMAQASERASQRGAEWWQRKLDFDREGR